MKSILTTTTIIILKTGVKTMEITHTSKIINKFIGYAISKRLKWRESKLKSRGFVIWRSNNSNVVNLLKH